MIARLVYFFALGVLAIGVVGIQLDRQAYNDPAVSVAVPSPFRAVAQQRQLELGLSPDEPQELMQDAQDLVRKRPIPARHLLLFAGAAEGLDDRDLAIAAIEVAATRGWREPGPQLAVAQAGLLSGDYPSAARRLAALVATGAAPDQTDILLASMLAEEGGRDALADLLAGDGTWKRWFVQRLRNLGQGEQFAATISMAWERGADLDCNQIRPAAERYLREGRPDMANSIWRGDCSSEPLSGD